MAFRQSRWVLFALAVSATAFADVHVTVHEKTFVIGPKVASGYFGVVHQGKDLHTGERVAIKLLHNHQNSHHNRESLRTEFRVAHELEEKAPEAPLAKGIGVGTTDESSPRTALVMRWLDGKSIGSLSQPAEKHAPKQAIKMVLEVLRALAALHASGWAHRDLHFGNIMMDGDRPESVKVVDTGGARKVDDKWGGNVHAINAPTGGTNRQSDLFSAGAILQGLLTGRAPSPGASVGELTVVHEGHQVTLQSVIDRAMDKDPQRRYQTAEEFATALAPFAAIP